MYQETVKYTELSSDHSQSFDVPDGHTSESLLTDLNFEGAFKELAWDRDEPNVPKQKKTEDNFAEFLTA